MPRFDVYHSGHTSGMSSDRPQSALNLRLALALFGLAFTVVLVILAVYFRNFALGVFAVVLGAVTVVDLVVIMIRRRIRRRREPEVRHSLFE
jgi:Flp pilus assembly protein TadB